MENPPTDERVWDHPVLRRAARWVGLGLFLAVGFLYLVSGLVAPVWAVAILWGAWLILLVTLVKVWRDKPWLVLALPIVAYLLWVVALLAGEFFLDWSA